MLDKGRKGLLGTLESGEAAEAAADNQDTLRL